jgi:ubiquinone biosynthesis protein COQ4
MPENDKKHNSYRPLEAIKGVYTLLTNPEDTAQVFRIVQALPGGSIERIHRGYQRTEAGRRILRERRQLLPTLIQHDVLAAMPAGSLGREYLAFLDAEGITADGLVEASENGFDPDRRRDDPELRLVSDRMRDMHDLWHVVAGYRGDLVGEAALLALTLPQIWSPGVALIVVMAWLEAPGADTRSEIWRGFARGRRAAYLPAQDWEALLPLPLDEVRRRLRLADPPVYRPVRTHERRRSRLGGGVERLRATIDGRLARGRSVDRHSGRRDALTAGGVTRSQRAA